MIDITSIKPRLLRVKLKWEADDSAADTATVVGLDSLGYVRVLWDNEPYQVYRIDASHLAEVKETEKENENA